MLVFHDAARLCCLGTSQSEIPMEFAVKGVTFNSPNFVMNQIVPPINQIEIKP